LISKSINNHECRCAGAAIHAEGFQARLMEFEHFERKFEVNQTVQRTIQRIVFISKNYFSLGMYFKVCYPDKVRVSCCPGHADYRFGAENYGKNRRKV
jgi:hypothetical protein